MFAGSIYGKLIVANVVGLIFFTSSALSQSTGSFNGRIIAEWLNDGRSMRITEPFEFVEADKTRWIVPKGAVVDGASIPTIFWSIMGAPFSGKYRNAAVIHDYFCDARTRDWRKVHKVFYDAMIASGVAPKTAWLLYQAVLKFGPQWDQQTINNACLTPQGQLDFDRCTQNSAQEKPKIISPQISKNDVLQFISEIEGQASSQDIQRLQGALKKIE